MTVVQKDGKTYYIFPDAAHNLAYVGGPKEYQTYRQIRSQQKKAERDPMERERRTDRVGRLGLLRRAGISIARGSRRNESRFER